MDEQPKLKLVLSQAAQSDLLEIWAYNASAYGVDHADEYIALVNTRLTSLLTSPLQGAAVVERPGFRRILIVKRAGGYGHIAFYRVQGDEVEVARVLHTAQNWQRIIERS